MVKVKLQCGVYGEGSVFSVEIERNANVEVLQEAIFYRKRYNHQYKFDSSALTLYLARNEDGEWLKHDYSVDDLLRGAVDPSYKKMLSSWKLDDKEYLGASFQPGKKEIHVLVELPESARQPISQSVQAESDVSHKKPRLDELKIKEFSMVSSDEDESKFIDPAKWKKNQWLNTQAIRDVTEFPSEYFVRQESIDLFKLFRSLMSKQIVFVGSPGVGKSLLLVLISFWMAFALKKSVLLVRHIKGKSQGVSAIFLSGKGNWRVEGLTIGQAVALVQQQRALGDIELCLDGFRQTELQQSTSLGILTTFSVLATSAQFVTKSDDSDVLDTLLMPFWKFSDLEAIGKRRNANNPNGEQWDNSVMEKKYFFSGGNLRSFLLDEATAKEVVDAALDDVTLNKADLLKTKYGSRSKDQVDHIRMTSVINVTPQTLTNYKERSKWTSVICSMYALRKLGEIVTLDYYEDLCVKAFAINDFGFLGTAFENWFHAMVTDRKEIRMMIREYDRTNTHGHAYSSFTINCESSLNQGECNDECEQVMSHWPKGVDYWYPASRSLKTIDCVARRSADNTFELLQLTVSKTHPIDGKYLKKISQWLSPHRYVAIVPNKTICDDFRLKPADPDTTVPLFVAYVDDRFFEQFAKINE